MWLPSMCLILFTVMAVTAYAHQQHDAIKADASNQNDTDEGCCSCNSSAVKGAYKSETDFIRDLVSSNRYDRNFRAVPTEGGATNVVVGLNVDSFGPIDAMRMDYSLEAVLQLRWQDLRLRFVEFSRPLVLSQIVDSVWKPGVFFQNAKEIHRHQVPSRNFLLWLWPNGTVQYNQKLNIKFHCHMNLKDFPFDVQSCSMIVSIFEMSTDDLVLHWSQTGIKFTDDSSVFLNEFFPPMVNLTAGCTESTVTGKNFSHLSATFRLKRKHMYYFITSYLPSVLIVLITWSSFAIDYRSAPARVSLCIMSLLALLTESAAIESKLPRVSYVTTLGIWHLCCIVFIHVSLLEYMAVNILIVISKRRKRQKTQGGGGSDDQQRLQKSGESLEFARCRSGRRQRSRRFELMLSRLRPGELDLFFLVFYPLVFGVFNFLYWYLLVPREIFT